MNVKERSNWTNKEIQYLKNVSITEYDLASGGLSVIKEFKLLDEKTIAKLDSLEKETKNITIGKMQAKDPTLTKNMVAGFGSAREMFVTQNGIPDQNILSIKKDALFLINCTGIKGKVSNFLNFRQKNMYSSYIRLYNKEMYYSSLVKELDIKGLSDEAKEYQKDYLLKDIARFVGQSEKISEEQLYNNLKKYRSDYLNKRLPIETYRELDEGIYRVGEFTMTDIDESFIDDLDISFNYKYYILPMIQYLLK